MKAQLAEGQYYGCCDASKKAGCLLLSECAYAAGICVPRHTHENPYFIFTLNGGQEEWFDGRERTYVPSTLAFHPAGEMHSERVGANGMRCLHVEFGPEWMERHAAISRFLASGWHFQAGRLGWMADSIHREFRGMDDVAPTIIEGLVLEILADASRLRRQESPGERPQWLSQAKDLIRSRFAEPLSLSEVAAAVGVSPVRLARAFRTQFHCSVGEFIRQVRIDLARQTMLSDDRPLADIALAVGFADQAHFARTFKRITGQTPGKFRAIARNR